MTPEQLGKPERDSKFWEMERRSFAFGKESQNRKFVQRTLQSCLTQNLATETGTLN